MSEEEMTSITSHFKGRSRLPITSNRSDESQNRKLCSDYHIDMEKNEGHESDELFGIKKKETFIVHSKTSTATTSSRKDILTEDPEVFRFKSNQRSPDRSSGHISLETNYPTSQTTGVYNFEENRLDANNFTVDNMKDKFKKQWVSMGYSRSKYSWYREPSSSHHAESSSHVAHHRESSSRRHRTSSKRHSSSSKRHSSSSKRHSSSSRRRSPEHSVNRTFYFGDNEIKRRRLSKYSHRSQSHESENKLQLKQESHEEEQSSSNLDYNGRYRHRRIKIREDEKENRRKSSKHKRRSAKEINNEVNDAVAYDEISGDEVAEQQSNSNPSYFENINEMATRKDATIVEMFSSSTELSSVKIPFKEFNILEMERDAQTSTRRENILKCYKIPKHRAHSKQNQTNSSFDNDQITKEKQPTTSKTYQRNKSDHDHGKSYHPKKSLIEPTTSEQKAIESKRDRNVDNKSDSLPHMSELDECSLKKPVTVTQTRLKINTLNRGENVEKEANESYNDNNIVFNEHDKTIKINDEKGNYRKSSEHKHCSATETTNGCTTNECTPNEIRNDEVSMIQFANKEVVGDEVADDVVTIDDVSSNGIATDEMIINDAPNNVVACGEVYPTWNVMTQNNDDEFHSQVFDVLGIGEHNIQFHYDSSQQTDLQRTDNDEMVKKLREKEESISLFTEAVAEYEVAMKQLQEQTESQLRTIEEQKKKIIEREQKIEEREKMIDQRNQWINDRNERIVELDRLLAVVTMERDVANLDVVNIVKAFNEEHKYCKENRTAVPKSTKQDAACQTISSSDFVEPLNLSTRSNGRQVNMQENSSTLTTINPMQENSTPILPTPSTFNQNAHSSSATTQYSFDSPNIPSTIVDAARISTSNNSQNSQIEQEEPQSNQIVGPNDEWALNNVSSTRCFVEAPQISEAQHMSPVQNMQFIQQTTTSNSSGAAETTNSSNVSTNNTPHQQLHNEPENRTSSWRPWSPGHWRPWHLEN